MAENGFNSETYPVSFRNVKFFYHKDVLLAYVTTLLPDWARQPVEMAVFR